MKKVLITGGKGYIARNLVPLFQAGGYDVIAPSRTEMDLLNEEMTSEYIQREKPNVIVHAAGRGANKPARHNWNTVYVENMTMWETLETVACYEGTTVERLFILGSGAEFDVRLPIRELDGSQIQYLYPMDPYGLSKNLITRRALQNYNHTYVLRLFGCFNWDEDDGRFIKASILNLKRGLPIEIYQNKEMDFFYLDDLYTVMDYIINHNQCPRDINMVYKDKLTLMNIASMITRLMGHTGPFVRIGLSSGEPYTGSAYALRRIEMLDENFSLIGLEEGIRRTILKLT